MLTDGVEGASDFRVHWLGWEGDDADLVLDLRGARRRRRGVRGHALGRPELDLHRRSVVASVSADGEAWSPIGTERVGGDQRDEPVTRTFTFGWTAPGIRYVRLRIENTKRLPDWHGSAGGTSWSSSTKLSSGRPPATADRPVARGPVNLPGGHGKT